MRVMHPVLVALALSALGACEMRRGPDVKSPATITQQGAPIVPIADAERPMSHRHEAQDQLDSARTALAGGDTSTAIRLLHRSAAFLVIQATEPPTGGTYDLLQSSAALDSLAGDVRRHGVTDTLRLMRQSALVNLAEAERHEALAGIAWSTHSEESVADELLMAADHFERASRDARLPLSGAALRVLGEMRTIAQALATRRELDVQTLDEPLAQFHLEVRALQRRLRVNAAPAPDTGR